MSDAAVDNQSGTIQPGATQPTDLTGAAPTGGKSRIEALDVIRGIAVLGILILNIPIMGQPFTIFQNPSYLAPASDETIFIWFISFVVFEGTFRTLFGMLFGAGVYLFMSRLEDRVGLKRARQLHIKRSLILALFGLIDAYLLIWVGDILFAYGLIGLIVWFFRGLKTKWLIAWVIVFALFSTFLKVGNAFSSEQSEKDYARLNDRVVAGETLSEEESGAYKALLKGRSFSFPSKEKLEKEIEMVRSGWLGTFEAYLPVIILLQTLFFFLFGIWDSLIAMLIGIMLFKSGFLKGQSSTRTYALWLVLGYGIGFGWRAILYQDVIASNFDGVVFLWSQIPYDLLRVLIAVGHISLVSLALRYAIMPFKNYFAAAGRMALTNYIGQSIFALVFFSLFGQYFRYSLTELYLICLGVWIVQLLYSRWWLSTHDQGPMEALWRRMTYGRQKEKATA